jgi:ferredoxin
MVFQPGGLSVQVEPGTALLDAARLAGVDLEAPCGGKGTCGRCNVRVAAGSVETDREGGLDDTEAGDRWVLACKARVGKGDVVIELVERTDEGGQFGEDKGLDFIESALLPAPEERRPLADKRLLRVPPPRKADGLSDLDRLTRALRQDGVSGPIHYSLQAIRHLGPALREAEGVVTVACHSEPLFAGLFHAPGENASQNAEGLWVVSVEKGGSLDRHYGVAVDVGTTTVSVFLVDLAIGEVLGMRSDYNGQLACGVDVISRIDYARRAGGREELRRRVLKTINRLIGALADQDGLVPQDIGCAVVSGNTTMIHLLLGLDPEFLRLDPFIPSVLPSPSCLPATLGLPSTIRPLSSFLPLWAAMWEVISWPGSCVRTFAAMETPSASTWISAPTAKSSWGTGNSFWRGLFRRACLRGRGDQVGYAGFGGACERVSIDPFSGKASFRPSGGKAQGRLRFGHDLSHGGTPSHWLARCLGEACPRPSVGGDTHSGPEGVLPAGRGSGERQWGTSP